MWVGTRQVPQEWAGPLHTFFQQRGYHFLLSLYGQPFNGYMVRARRLPRDGRLSRVENVHSLTRVRRRRRGLASHSAPRNTVRIHPIALGFVFVSTARSGLAWPWSAAYGRCTAMQKLRIVVLGFGTARQKMVLE